MSAIAVLSTRVPFSTWNNDYPGIEVKLHKLYHPYNTNLSEGLTQFLVEEDEKAVAATVEKHQKYNFERLVVEGRGERLVIVRSE